MSPHLLPLFGAVLCPGPLLPVLSQVMVRHEAAQLGLRRLPLLTCMPRTHIMTCPPPLPPAGPGAGRTRLLPLSSRRHFSWEALWTPQAQLGRRLQAGPDHPRWVASPTSVTLHPPQSSDPEMETPRTQGASRT